jgi:hypothetical protein
MTTEMTVLWDVALRSYVETDRRFRDAYCLHHQGDKSLIRLVKEAINTSEKSAKFYENTRCKILEDVHFH